VAAEITNASWDGEPLTANGQRGRTYSGSWITGFSDRQQIP
jgi:hypothetical protein